MFGVQRKKDDINSHLRLVLMTTLHEFLSPLSTDPFKYPCERAALHQNLSGFLSDDTVTVTFMYVDITLSLSENSPYKYYCKYTLCLIFIYLFIYLVKEVQMSDTFH